MQIVVLGNCQANCVADAVRRACAPDPAIRVHAIAAYRSATPADLQAIAAAAILVEQLTDTQQRTSVPPDAGPSRRIGIPLLEGSFLYPFSTIAHPRNPDSRATHPPDGAFVAQMSDSRLIALMRRHAADTPAQITARYLALDYAQEVDLDALKARSQEKATRLGAQVGLDLWPRIERLFRYEPVFWTALHPAETLLRPIYRHVLNQLPFGLSDAEIDAAVEGGTGLAYSHMPIHPSIAQHFEIDWVSERTLYRLQYEGLVTTAEFADRFIRFGADGALVRAMHDLQGGGDPRPVLSVLLDARARQPRNAELLITIATLFTRLGDVPNALEASVAALTLEPDHPNWVQLHLALVRLLVPPIALPVAPGALAAQVRAA